MADDTFHDMTPFTTPLIIQSIECIAFNHTIHLRLPCFTLQEHTHSLLVSRYLDTPAGSIKTVHVEVRRRYLIHTTLHLR